MPKFLQISIPESCSEAWDKMHPNAKGRFCDSCQKTVTDFTGLTDAQIISRLKDKNESGCGRFSADQLERNILIPKKQIPWAKYFFTVSIPAFLLTLKATAQFKGTAAPIEFVDKEHKPIVELAEASFNIKGRLTDEKGEAIEGASVRVTATQRGIATDQEGYFELRNIQPGQQLQFSCIGCLSKIVQIINDSYLNVSLQRGQLEMGGVVVTIGGLRVNRSKKTTEVKKAIKSIPKETEINSITVFPNPATAFQNLSVSWKNKVSGKQLIEIFSANGNLVQNERFSFWSKLSTISIALKALPAGFYIVKVTDLKTNEKFSKEFIVK